MENRQLLEKPKFFVWWFQDHGRDFPWRKEGVTPFQLLVTEMLLRQTQATQVDSLWNDFMDRFETPEDLAGAEPGDLYERIKELGFGNQRVEALTTAATHLLEYHGGNVPAVEDKLMEIPHIGPYAAHAVMCFAHDKSVPVVDTNILRLFCRLLDKNVNRLDIRREPWAWEMAHELLPEKPKQAQEHNYGLLDFTAAVCKAKSPLCPDCPLSIHCSYGQKIEAGIEITQLP